MREREVLEGLIKTHDESKGRVVSDFRLVDWLCYWLLDRLIVALQSVVSIHFFNRFVYGRLRLDSLRSMFFRLNHLTPIHVLSNFRGEKT